MADIAPRSSEDEATRPLSVIVGAIGGLVLALSELVVLAVRSSDSSYEHLGPGTYATALTAVAILATTLNVFVPLALAWVVHFIRPRLTPILWLLIAGGFGALWQDTVMHGDGIRSFQYYEAIRVAGWVLGPAIVMAWTALLGFWRRPPISVRRGVAAAVAVGGVIVSQTVLLSYDEFHGYLALFSVAHILWLAAPLLRNPIALATSIILVLASMTAVVTLPQWMSAQRYTQHFSEIPASLMTLPTTRPLALPPESVLDPNASFSAARIAEIRRSLSAIGGPAAPRPRGKNVLFVVLESTRADAWADPEIAPDFHEWKKHGLYFPDAIAQYPATPLAYGAMFTSQPPSVLTQTPQWARSRLFDRIGPQFDELILTRPQNEWFDHSAITDFFVPKSERVMKHGDVTRATQNVRRELQKLDDGETFFAWMHIYEPHQPWERREKYAKGQGKRAAYLSEVRLVDDVLGDFMTWFYEQPFADETLVIMYSDHGEGMGEKIDGKRYWGHHVHVHNVVSRIPAYVSGPGLPKNETAEDFTIQQLDAMPTIFDFLGEELPADTFAQGESVYRLLESRSNERDFVTEAFSIRGKDFFEFVADVRDEKADVIRERFAEVTTDGKYSPKIALQHGEYKIIRDMLLERTRLYDVERDPDESEDLSEELPEVKREMEKRLANWRERQAWIIRQLEAE